MSCCPVQIINVAQEGANFAFNVTGGDGPASVTSGPFAVGNGDTLHFWSDATVTITVTPGDARVELSVDPSSDPDNILVIGTDNKLFVPGYDTDPVTGHGCLNEIAPFDATDAVGIILSGLSDDVSIVFDVEISGIGHDVDSPATGFFRRSIVIEGGVITHDSNHGTTLSDYWAFTPTVSFVAGVLTYKFPKVLATGGTQVIETARVCATESLLPSQLTFPLV